MKRGGLMRGGVCHFCGEAMGDVLFRGQYSKRDGLCFFFEFLFMPKTVWEWHMEFFVMGLGGRVFGRKVLRLHTA